MLSKWLLPLLIILLLLNSTLLFFSAQASSSKWLTLLGKAPLVIGRGGFSGIFPDSSYEAYTLAMMTSVPDVILWCDVQLTKNGTGICAPDVDLANSTNIKQVYANTPTTFSVDFTDDELFPYVTLTQGIYSRSPNFDGNAWPIQTPEAVAALKPKGLWLNIQHDAFFTQHKLSIRSYILSVIRSVVVQYISSPEVAFLKNIAPQFNANTTKMVFRFLELNGIERSTNQTYGSLSKKFSFIKTFASGILIPKSYIWPVDSSNYLEPHTSIVMDAHEAGLEVYASEFSNDVPLSFNYSYDPLSEYLNHIDNGNFCVDGVLTDFPITPSEARDCFAHLGKTALDQVNLTVISKNGASGDYPGCTDLAYKAAIADGADVIDCPVQVSKDGIPFCLRSLNLLDSTNAAQKFRNIVPGIGLETFLLTWTEIQTLTPAISNPQSSSRLFRNPKYRNAGQFMTLSDFLALAKNSSSISGVLISIENAAHLIRETGLHVIDIVLNTLNDAGYNNQTTKKVMIQSTNSSVLMKFKDKTNYELVYTVNEDISDMLVPAIEDIKSFAHSVVVSKESVISENEHFLERRTDVVPKLQAANLSVYVHTFSNEFMSQAWDFFADSTVEVNNYVMAFDISGVITDFPKTPARYRRNRCLKLGNSTPAYMTPVQPGGLMSLISAQYLPPAEAPNPPLTLSDIIEAPLPSETPTSPFPIPGGTPKSLAQQPNIAAAATMLIVMSHLAIVANLL